MYYFFSPYFYSVLISLRNSLQMSQTAPHNLSKVKHIVMVLSGKGGVGKSTVACQLALTLALRHHKKVGLLDVDICGPSVPRICGLGNCDVYKGPTGWRPVSFKEHHKLDGEGDVKVMSIAYLLPSENDAVVWRGPKKDAIIKQFINEVEWGELDFLIVDTPPGTSDEHLTLCETLKGPHLAGAVIVTTPQSVSTDDVRKELSLCYKLEVRCLGIVENMSGFVCPHCEECTDIFHSGGGEKLAQQYEVPFLGNIPIDPTLSLCEDNGEAFCGKEGGKTDKCLVAIIENIVQQVERAKEVVA
ncbi:nucleotide binding protein-like protein [Angomonas deanei]|uniref:Cytosolic Fe-S cluster assembly factor NUBP2 homolog n=1 Tax=Angomonas deanei TaxID=59799 RepID=A0A7G2CAV7_9TRYP|nr:nucleotide binding protein-like protein [Angomonas deanei]CAD2215883.1 NUBPL iron-transfer P-loop NTPase/Anion-transporting ATPase/CobQ/CobB/MinD/ParA nucleotide binding domain containing protein, putative [Angomonas deanei]|eukprot:EPY39203.1 nucleotide binding protein-like protein [Angomonas deanei]